MNIHEVDKNIYEVVKLWADLDFRLCGWIKKKQEGDSCSNDNSVL